MAGRRLLCFLNTRPASQWTTAEISTLRTTAIRWFDAVTGVFITTIAGNGNFLPISGDGGPAISATVAPYRVSVDSTAQITGFLIRSTIVFASSRPMQ